MTLIYLRHNVAFCVVGRLFDVSADVAENTFHEILGVLKEVCPSDRWEAEKRRTGYPPGAEPAWKPDEIDQVIVDSFETPVPRPSVEPKQRRLYSGKKKDHTLKTEVITDMQGEILAIDPGHRGPKSDKKLHEQSEVGKRFPHAQVNGDLAYKGLSHSQVPHKKPRGGELTRCGDLDDLNMSQPVVRLTTRQDTLIVDRAGTSIIGGPSRGHVCCHPR